MPTDLANPPPAADPLRPGVLANDDYYNSLTEAGRSFIRGSYASAARSAAPAGPAPALLTPSSSTPPPTGAPPSLSRVTSPIPAGAPRVAAPIPPLTTAPASIPPLAPSQISLDPEHVPAFHSALGSFLGKTGDIATTAALHTFIHGPAPAASAPASVLPSGPAPGSSSPPPGGGIDVLSYRGSRYDPNFSGNNSNDPQAFARAGLLPTGPAPGSNSPSLPAPSIPPSFGASRMDAPDLQTRVAALKLQTGHPLTEAEWNRVGTRVGLEGAPGASTPNGSLSDLLHGTPMDPNVRAAEAAQRGLNLSRTQQDIDTAAAREDLSNKRTQLGNQALERENTQAATAQDQDAKLSAVLRANPNPSQADLAAGGVTSPAILEKYRAVPRETPGYGTYAEAAAALPTGSRGTIEQRDNGRFYVRGENGPAKAEPGTTLAKLWAEREALAADPKTDPKKLASWDSAIAAAEKGGGLAAIATAMEETSPAAAAAADSVTPAKKAGPAFDPAKLGKADKDAYDWATANANDPRALGILQRLHAK